MNDCKAISAQIPWFLNGTLSVEEESSVIAHTSVCEGCNTALQHSFELFDGACTAGDSASERDSADVVQFPAFGQPTVNQPTGMERFTPFNPGALAAAALATIALATYVARSEGADPASSLLAQTSEHSGSATGSQNLATAGRDNITQINFESLNRFDFEGGQL